MKTVSIGNTNFQGSMYKIGKLNHKPQICYGKDLKQQKENQPEKEFNEQDLEEIGDFFRSLSLLPCFMIIGIFTEGVQETGKYFKQLVNNAKNFAIKKG